MARQRQEFPWRKYSDPWHVLLAEMLLLRTRRGTVARLVPSLVERFPTPERMANEDLESVDAALRPLGLRWRALKLHQLALSIVKEHGGLVPFDFDALTELPGVGPYVASATLSALTGQKVLLTDANTVRVAQRVAGLRLKGDVRRRKEVQLAISLLLGGKSTIDDWFGILDLAATVCRPVDPRCTSCPILSLCVSGRERAANHEIRLGIGRGAASRRPHPT
jgi:A/G-specific adenine glycosylase